MPRPVKWSRDAHAIRDQASRSRTETWSRQDIERLFDVGRASAQSLMKAIGEVQAVGGTHFVERASLLSFLDEMIAADSIEIALRKRMNEAAPVPKQRSLRVTLSPDLRHAMLPDLPPNIKLSPGHVEITAETAVKMAEALFALAMVMQNDLDRWEQIIEPPVPQPQIQDDDLCTFLADLRNRSNV